MIKQLIGIWCGFSSSYTILHIITFAIAELRIENHNIAFVLASAISGIVGGLVYFYLTKIVNALVILSIIIMVTGFWLYAFPCPEWRNPLLWHWPLYGFVTFFAVPIIMQMSHNKTLQRTSR
jgi:hypothetical protein